MRRPICLVGVILLLVLAACGDDSSGQPCSDSLECPEVDCGQGVSTQVCIDRECVVETSEACSYAQTVAAGSVVSSGVGGGS